MSVALVPIAAFLAAAAIAAAVTPLFARLARSCGLMVIPREDRWHRELTPLLGGAAIALAALVALALVLPDPQSRGSLVLMGGAAAAFALGLLDDFRHLAPSTKLVGQALVGALLVSGGVSFELVPFPPLAFVVTVFWVVGMMNALNLMDNMDGLAAGITVIAAGVLTVTAIGGDPVPALVASATAGAAAGFLVHNFHPARVFMGDAGSQLLGYLLATAALLHTAAGAANVGVALVGPLVVLGLPIFDTALVMASRWWAGLPVSRGGRDHTSHRLSALGLSDRATVLFLYAVAAVLAGLGLALDAISSLFLPLLSLVVVVFALFGVFLLEADSRRAAEPSSRGRVLRTLSTYLRFGFEVGLDVILLTAVYYSAYLIRFEGLPDSAWLYLFVQSLPVVVGLQLVALVVLGVYRTLWRYLGVPDAIALLRAVTIGTAAGALAVLVLFRFEGYSRAVFVLDWVVAGALLIGSRSFLLWLRHWFAGRPRASDRRVVIVGATDAGAAALRLLARAESPSYRVVGFLDDDPGKRYRRIGGVRIVGDLTELAHIVQRLAVELVVLATDDPDSLEQARASCQSLGVECREFRVPV